MKKGDKFDINNIKEKAGQFKDKVYKDGKLQLTPMQLKVAAGCSGLIVLIALIAVLVAIALNSSINTPDSSTEVEETIPPDTAALDEVLNETVASDLEVISNINNEQSDVILETVGVDIIDVYSYAAAIDSRLESADTIVVLNPKEGKAEDIKHALSNYISKKQRYFMDNGLTETEAYRVVQNGLIDEYYGYIILIIQENASQIKQSIRNGIASHGLVGRVPVEGGYAALEESQSTDNNLGAEDNIEENTEGVESTGEVEGTSEVEGTEEAESTGEVE